MKRLILRAGLILVASGVLGIGASAQVYPGGGSYNPLTGGQAAQALYNPLTGSGAPSLSRNVSHAAGVKPVHPATVIACAVFERIVWRCVCGAAASRGTLRVR